MLITSKEAQQIAAKNEQIQRILNRINNVIANDIEKGSTVSKISLVGITRGTLNTILNEIENAGYTYEYLEILLDSKTFEINITITA